MNSYKIERKAVIFNIQKYSIYDGPGIRTLVFFQGCPLRCKWCANPEGLERRPRILWKEDFCVHCGKCVKVCPVQKHRMTAERKHIVLHDVKCIGCGACTQACHVNALDVCGHEESISEILEKILEDRTFYEVSGGGVTLGGGEVLAQPRAAIGLLMACKQNGIHTAIETCGYAKTEDVREAAKYVDLFLFDMKHIDPEKHYEGTGVRNDLIKKNLEMLLIGGKQVKVRMPLLSGYNTSEEDIRGVLEFLSKFQDLSNFHGIDLLPYHKLGINKYRQLGISYRVEGDPSLSNEELEQIEQWVKQYGVKVNIVRH